MTQTNAKNLDYAEPLVTSLCFSDRAKHFFYDFTENRKKKTATSSQLRAGRVLAFFGGEKSALARLLRDLATPRLTRNHRIKFDRGRAWRAENRQLDLMLIVV